MPLGKCVIVYSREGRVCSLLTVERGGGVHCLQWRGGGVFIYF